MVDANDIDALLISALYGELTPADEARLATHLESHPADRGVLADLTHARTLIRDSRLLSFQVDPPQAVSALLLQEAARRAPAVRRAPADEGRESWFFRFVRSFAAHPAMAAAAMLVLVVGAAGVMKMRDRGTFDETPVESRARLEAPAGTATARADQGEAPAHAAPAEPTDAVTGQPALDEAQLRQASGEKEGGFAVALAEPAAAADAPKHRKVADGADLSVVPTQPAGHAAAGKKGIGVTTPELALKDEYQYGANNDEKAAGSPVRDLSKSKTVTKPPAKLAADDRDGIGSGPGASGGAAAPPAPTVATSPPPAPRAAPAKAPQERAADKSGDAPNTLDAWATGQLAQVVQLAHADRCDDAAKVAVAISTRAPEFYAEKVATNRELKQCMAYIAALHDRAEKAAAEKRAAAQRATSTDSTK